MKVVIHVADGPGEEARISIDGKEITDRVFSWSAEGDRHHQSVTFTVHADEVDIEMSPDYLKGERP